MKKKYQILGCLGLIVCSIIYDYQKPEIIQEEQKQMSYVMLEGEFLYQGKYEYEGQKTMEDIVNDVGVSQQANLNAIMLSSYVEDESRIYLPAFHDQCVSLNHASLEELMTLNGVGEKTAMKIIEYRTTHPFEQLEDIMNISGIGEKTYLKLSDYLCL